MSRSRLTLKLPVFLVGLAMIVIAAWGLLRPSNSPQRSRFIELGVGDAYELAPNQKIVLLKVDQDAKCDFQLINCENNQCVILERFSMRLEEDFFLLGLKLRTVQVKPEDYSLLLEISKM